MREMLSSLSHHTCSQAVFMVTRLSINRRPLSGGFTGKGRVVFLPTSLPPSATAVFSSPWLFSYAPNCLSTHTRADFPRGTHFLFSL